MHILKHITASLLLLMTVSATTLRAQEVEMSQYFAAPLHLNPAMAGISFGPRATLNYRNQWSSMGDGFNGGYTTYMAGFDMQIDKIKGGIGALFVGDQIMNGIYGKYSASLMYAQQIRFNRKSGMKIGISGTYMYTAVKWQDLRFSDMINPYTGFNQPGTVDVPNPTGEPTPAVTARHNGEMGAGFVIFTPKLYFGFAVSNLLMHKENFNEANEARMPMRFNVHFGAHINIKHKSDLRYKVYFSPNILFVNQGRAFQAQATALFGVSFVYFGPAFRHSIYNSDAIIFHLGVRKGRFRVGYSYDYTIGRLANRTGGTHEISFTFNWTGDDNSLNPRFYKNMIDCPAILKF